MPILNRDIVENFNKVADLLEIKGANPFRVRAYRNAARTIGGLSISVAGYKPVTVNHDVALQGSLLEVTLVASE